MRTISGWAALAPDGLHDVRHRRPRCPDRQPGCGRDLFTAGSVQYNAVATAWSAVGVS